MMYKQPRCDRHGTKTKITYWKHKSVTCVTEISLEKQSTEQQLSKAHVYHSATERIRIPTAVQRNVHERVYIKPDPQRHYEESQERLHDETIPRHLRLPYIWGHPRSETKHSQGVWTVAYSSVPNSNCTYEVSASSWLWRLVIIVKNGHTPCFLLHSLDNVHD